MSSDSLRLFFAVNLPAEVKREIAEKLLPLVPAEKWRKVLPENLHVTLLFLGYMDREAGERMREQAKELESFGEFEAELNSVGHFKGRVLWIGIGRGTDEFCVLSKKLQAAIGVKDKRFHPHVTLARNRGAGKGETAQLVERMRGIGFRARVQVRGFELMQSELHKAGPKYSRVFSTGFSKP